MRPFDGVPKVSSERGALALATTDETVEVDLSTGPQTIQPPAGCRVVIFAASGDFAVQFLHGTPAAFPSANVLTPGANEELNPAARYIGDRVDEQANLDPPVNYTFSVAGGGTGFLTIGFYT